MTRVTKKEFEEFKKGIKYWMDFFGLKGWSVTFRQAKLDRSLASVMFNCKSRGARFTFCTEVPDKHTKDNLDPSRAAFHEVCHILLGRIDDLITDRFISISEPVEAIHEVIRTLETVIYESQEGL